MKNEKLRLAVRLALLTALQVVLSRFAAISTPVVKISFGFVPVMLAGAIYGVPGGFTVAVISDLIGALLFPQGVFFIGYTITAALSGVLYGLFLHKDRKPAIYLVKIILAYVLNALAVTLGLNTLCIAFQYGYLLPAAHDWSNIGVKFAAFLPKRILEAAIMVPVQVSVTYLLLVCCRLHKLLAHMTPLHAPRRPTGNVLLAAQAFLITCALCIVPGRLPALPEGMALVRYLSEYMFTDMLLGAAVFTLSVVLLKNTRCAEYSASERLCGLFLACAFVLSGTFYSGNSSFFTDALRLTLFFICLIGAYFLFRALSALLLQLFDRQQGREGAFHRFLPAGIIFACCIPYLVITGGTLTSDAYDQLGQVLGTYSRSAAYSVGASSINTTQPVAHTLLLGGAYRLAGQAGITLFAVLQTALYALAAGRSISLACRLGAGKRLTLLLLLLYALMPLYPLYSCATLKDSAFAIALFSALTFACELYTDPDLRLSRRLGGAAVWLLTGLLRPFGLYLLLFVLLALLLKYRRIPFASILRVLGHPAAGLVLCALVLYAVYPLCGVSRGPESENRSLMLQQTALYLKDNPDDLNKTEKQAIENVLGLQTEDEPGREECPYRIGDLAGLYDPILANPIKNLALNYTGSWKEYDKSWLTMGLRHPGSYLKAALCMESDYWDLRRDAPDNGLLLYLGDFGRFEDGFTGEDPRAEAFGVDYRMNEASLSAARVLKSGILALSRLPMISWLFRPALYLYALVLVFAYLCKKRAPGKALALTPILLGLGLVFAPLGGSTRYAYPIILCAPSVCLWCIAIGQKKNSPDRPD